MLQIPKAAVVGGVALYCKAIIFCLFSLYDLCERVLDRKGPLVELRYAIEF